MGVKWRDFQMPKRLECDEASYTTRYGRFIAEPFERGYGVTLGNSLRRILLSSIEGSAVTAIKIDGVPHEFSTMTGVLEPITDVVLNIKGLVFRSHSKVPKTIYVKMDKSGPVKAKDIITDETVEVINQDHLICTLTQDIPFNMELEICRGRGYVPADQNKKEGASVGMIAVDSIFTPITKVNYFVENTRVGQRTDYDRLVLELWTNGGIEPKEALLYGANILQRHLDVFVAYGQLPEEEEEEEATTAPAQEKAEPAEEKKD
jgi:DNA-directed RNA polymerase subunit alpha